MQIPPGLSITLFDLSLDCIPESHVLEQLDQLPQIPQTQGQGWILQLFWSFADPAQIPPGLSTLLFVLVRDSIPSSQVVEHEDQLLQSPQMHGQDLILQLFLSFADPSQIPLGLSALLFVLVRDSIPSSQVLEHRDQLDQEPHSQSTGNMKFHYMGIK